MKTFILVLLVGACLAATLQRPNFKRKRNENDLGNRKRSPGKAARGILNLLKQNPRHVRRESANSDVDKRYDDYYSDYNTSYETSDYYYGDYYSDYSWYLDYSDFWEGYWQGYWYGYYMGYYDGYDWGYVAGNTNGFDIGFSNGFYDAKNKYNWSYKRDVGKRSGSPMKRSKTRQDANAKGNEALKTIDNTEKVQM